MESYGINFSEEVKNNYNETISALDLLHKRLGQSYERDEMDKIRFSKELRESINVVTKRVNDLKEELNDSRISNKDSPTGQMVIFMNDIKDKVDELYEDTEAYREYLIELDMERKNFEEVNDLVMDFRLKYNMWKALHE